MSKIKLADKVIEMDDIIDLTSKQVDDLNKISISKSQQQWFKSKTGKKVILDEDQHNDIKEFKKLFFDGENLETVINKKMVKFEDHAERRIAQRIEGKTPNDLPNPETVKQVICLFMQSNHLDNIAHWKGSPNLTFTCWIKYDERSYGVCFYISNDGIVIVTVKNGRGNRPDKQYTSLMDILKNKRQIKEKRNQVKSKRGKNRDKNKPFLGDVSP
jgi:hypothetical protein